MIYNSPFDTIFDIFSIYDLSYEGTLDKVLSDIAMLPSDKSIHTENDAGVWGLHPPRIIRAIVDYKIKHPNIPETGILLQEAISIALGIYSNPTNSAKAVDKLRDKITTTHLEDLLDSPLIQECDPITWSATCPLNSEKTVQQLVHQTRYDPLLFIALAHGGVAAGMDVYLRYCDAFENKDSAFYVARLSTNKLGDNEPRLSSREIDYLRELANGRQVVVFDEDVSSGTTFKIARNYFSKQVFQTTDIIMVTNKDMRKISIGSRSHTKYFISSIKKESLNPQYSCEKIKDIQLFTDLKILISSELLHKFIDLAPK